MHAYIHAHIHTCTHTYTHARTHTHMHTHTRIHVHTHAQSWCTFNSLFLCTCTCSSFLTAWDLLRIDVQGFTEFCDAFLKKYPGYFVSPIRLTGSAVESLFAQYKYTTGGKLDAANYSVARAAFLTKQAISNHHSGKGYRDTPLHIQPVPLEKKKYGKRMEQKQDI